ncbi:MAG: signal peptidase I [Anaerolineae bacterium]
MSSPWWAEPPRDDTRFYRGRSMAGTFRAGDRLTLASATIDEVRPGDVVVYTSTHGGGRDELVHRIVSVAPDGLVARGDNNPCPDPVVVTDDNLLGRVTHVERAGRTWPVPGGWWGLLHARRQRIRVALWRWAKAVGRRPYRRLRASGLVARYWRPTVQTVRVTTDKGPVVKYVCEGRTVAEWWPEQDRFECRKPYDLVIPRPERPQEAVDTSESLEFAFLVNCVGHCLDPIRPLPAPPEALNWPHVYRLLQQHRLGGLFCLLGWKHPDLWPKEMQGQLRLNRYRALIRGDKCQAQVRQVLTALTKAGIPVLVLKGWAMIPTVYGGDHGQRLYEDIDVVVRPQDGAQAEQVLCGLGYEGTMAEPWPGYRRRYRVSRAYLLSTDPAPLGQPFAISLHWGLLDTPFYDRRISIDDLFERARPLQVAGVEVQAMAWVDDLIYSCGHLALHHGYDGALFRYFELASIILRSGPDFDWKTATDRAAAWRLVVPTRHAMRFLDEFWPGIVPSDALDEILSLQPTRTEELVHRLVIEHQENRTVRVLLNWLTLPGLARRATFILETAVPRPAHLRERYGPPARSLWPLLYLRHAAAAVQDLLRPGDEQS